MSYISQHLSPRDFAFPAASCASTAVGPTLFDYDDNLIFESETLGKRIREDEGAPAQDQSRQAVLKISSSKSP